MIKVDLRADGAFSQVREIYDKLSSSDQQRALMKNIGVRAEAELRGWFYRRDAENPNKMGWPRQHFWARIARVTAWDPAKTTENSATVVVADPALAAKIDGAIIRPIAPRQNLAIPMRPEAYGVMPRSGIIPGLFVYRSTTSNGLFLVRQGAGASFGSQGANLEFFYRLVPEVTVPKDPQALPPPAALGEALAQTASAFFRRQSGGQN